MVIVWCGILVSAGGFIKNGGMFKCSVAGIEIIMVYTEVWTTISESTVKCKG